MTTCCIAASYCHLSANLQTMSIIVVNLQDNRAVFRIFIALLKFSFDSPCYVREVEPDNTLLQAAVWFIHSFIRIQP